MTIDVTEMSWEQRVEALEAALSARDEQIEALNAAVTEYRAREKSRVEQAAADYVRGIKAAACKAGSPIDAAKLDKVQAHFLAGNEETARDLGDALLALSQARGGGEVGATDEPKIVSLGATDSDGAGWSTEAQAEFNKRWAHKLASKE